MSTLTEMYAAACEASDPVLRAARDAAWARLTACRLETAALESGAMPSEFKVMLRYTPCGGCWRFTPVLR